MIRKILLGLTLTALVACNENKTETQQAQEAPKAPAEVKVPAAETAPAKDIPVDKTSIFKAIETGDVELLKAAIAKGMNVNDSCNVLDDVNTCFMAGHKNECSEKGAEVFTPLFLASRKGNYEMVKALVDAGANVMAENKACGNLCEPECFTDLREFTADFKTFFPEFNGTDTDVYSNDRIKIALLFAKAGGNVPVAYPSDLLKIPELDEDLMLDYLKMIREQLSLEFKGISFVEAEGKVVAKSNLNLAEEVGKQKVAEYFKSVGVKSVLKINKLKHSSPEVVGNDIENCEDVYKVFYSDGTTSIAFNNCGT